MYKALVEVEHLTKTSCDVQLEMIQIIDELIKLETSISKLINELKNLKSELYLEIENVEIEKRNVSENCNQN